MAKKATKSEAFQKLKDDLKAGDIGCAYIFHGEESYLREYYLGEMRKTLVPAGFDFLHWRCVCCAHSLILRCKTITNQRFFGNRNACHRAAGCGYATRDLPQQLIMAVRSPAQQSKAVFP